MVLINKVDLALLKLEEKINSLSLPTDDVYTTLYHDYYCAYLPTQIKNTRNTIVNGWVGGNWGS